jgi:peptidoglycan/xylan/chitin deacetylase (PgdA/CDA1 family)
LESALERRDFLKVMGASFATVASSALPQSFLNVANAASVNTIIRLPESDTARFAWTVDDGCSHDAVKSYINFVAENDLRLTFFVYAGVSPWQTNAKLLKPFVESGQIQLANHTMHHPLLTKLSAKEVQKELMDCHNFMERHYGIDAKPYYRPPYGGINAQVIDAAAEIGYTKPMLWSGTLADSGKVGSAKFMSLAKAGFRDRGIVLGHANNMVAPNHFDRLLDIVISRGLSTVTLTDAFDV